MPERSSRPSAASDAQAQDAYALESHRKAAAATDAGRFADGDPSGRRFLRRRATPIVFAQDESIRRDTTLEALGALAPGVREGRHRHGRQCAAGQRWRRGAGRDVERARDGAGRDADGAHRRAGVERPRPEARADDAGRSDPPRAREDGMEDRGRRSLRDQRGLLGAADRGAASSSASIRRRST